MEQSTINHIYKTVDNYKYLISPISIAITGGITFGATGAVLGLTLSTIDGLLLYNNLTKEQHLTSILTGIVLGYTLHPSKISCGMGLIASILLSYEGFNNYYEIVNYPLISTLVLTNKIGLSGAIIGITLGGLDYMALYNNITDKYYISCIILGVMLTGNMWGKSLTSGLTGILLGLILSNYQDNILTPIKISQELYDMYTTIIPEESIYLHIKEYSITLLNIQIFTQYLLTQLLKYQQGMIYQFEHINSSQNIDNFNIFTKGFLYFLIPHTINAIVSGIVNSYYSFQLHSKIEDSLRNRLFNEKIILNFFNNKNNTSLIDNLRIDSKEITYKGAELITDSLSKAIKGTCGLSILITNAADILIYTTLYNQFTKYISNILSDKEYQYDAQIKILESQISSILKHDTHNIKTVLERGGLQYSQQQLEIKYNLLNFYEYNKKQITSVIEGWRIFTSTADFIYNYYLIGYKINQGMLSFDKRIAMHYSCTQVSKLFSWEGEKSQEIKTLYTSMERIQTYLNNTSLESIKNIDHIKREYDKYNDKLVLSNVNIAIQNKDLIRINYLELKLGERYIISGESGSGKSSLISKIIGIQGNQVEGSGTISYPKDSSIHVISQQDYFPLYKNLLEIVFYPKPINLEKSEVIKNLLVKLNLNQYKIEQTLDWYNVLSGGEKKKIMIISAIIQNPKILILDEAFNGLDHYSTQIIQDIIINYLPDSLILSIDHTIKEVNKSDFYTGYLKIEKGLLFNEDFTYSSKKEVNLFDQECHITSEINFHLNNNEMCTLSED